MGIVRSNRLGFSLAIALAMSLTIIVLQEKYIRNLQVNEEEPAARGTIKDGVSVPGSQLPSLRSLVETALGPQRRGGRGTG